MNPQPQTQPEISRETIAQDLRELVKHKLDNTQLDAAVESVFAPATRFPATGSIASLVLYVKFQIQIKEPTLKTFNGNAFGAAIPGGGALVGSVFTPNLTKLLRDTSNFIWDALPAYTGVYFFNSQGGLLGHAQFGAISTVGIGGGGGDGGWS